MLRLACKQRKQIYMSVRDNPERQRQIYPLISPWIYLSSSFRVIPNLCGIGVTRKDEDTTKTYRWTKTQAELSQTNKTASYRLAGDTPYTLLNNCMMRLRHTILASLASFCFGALFTLQFSRTQLSSNNVDDSSLTNENLVQLFGITEKDEAIKNLRKQVESLQKSLDDTLSGETLFLNTVQSIGKPFTDKITTHTYQTMYGKYLIPFYKKNPRMKMLEIGLGCNMKYGPGASVKLWRELFPEANLWEAEYDANCVKKATENHMLIGFNTLTGDQGSEAVLNSWIEKSGGNFDVIIDDGGHQNCQIYTSFVKLWPTLKPGGLYFIEDMQVARTPAYMEYMNSMCNNTLIMPEVLKGVMDDLIYDIKRKGDVEFMSCQSEACVLGKRS